MKKLIFGNNHTQMLIKFILNLHNFVNFLFIKFILLLFIDFKKKLITCFYPLI